MNSQIINLLQLSERSLVINKNFECSCDEFEKKLGTEFFCFRPGLLQLYRGEAKIIIDGYEDYSQFEREELEKFVYDSRQVIYLRNPFELSTRLEGVIKESGKGIFLLDLSRGILSNFKFLKLSWLAPRVRRAVFGLICRVKPGYFRFDEVPNEKNLIVRGLWLDSMPGGQSKVFQILSLAAKSSKNCYILGINRPRGSPCLQLKA